jgi:hypothetical protein
MNRRGFVKCGLQTIAAGLVGRTQRANATSGSALLEPDQEERNRAVRTPFYDYDLLKWLYIGWENDHPKSWTFMGGGVAPGLGDLIQYTVTVDGATYTPDEFALDRKSRIKWYLRDGYLPCPISQWMAGTFRVEIQHFANRVLADHLTAVYSRVRVTSTGLVPKVVRLNVSSRPDIEIPLSGECTGQSNTDMYFDISVNPGDSVTRDFVAFAAGSPVEPAVLKSAGGFDSNYETMAKYWNGRMAGLAEPISLPVAGMVEMYKSIQITTWENMVKNGEDYEIHAAPRNPFNNDNYDQPFSHDAPNYVDQYMREGDFEIAKRMLASKYFKASNSTTWRGREATDPIYEDTLGKYLIPYAEYLRCTGDLAYFTVSVREELKKAVRNIHALRSFNDKEHYGLMKKSQDFENWADDGDYLLCDNWSALHGLQAYQHICRRLGEMDEAEWAAKEMVDLNDSVNRALSQTSARRHIDYYEGGFDDVTLERYGDSDYSWVPYSGALSTFPWGAYLKGFDLGGFWKEKFDDSIRHALEVRDRKGIPEGSWGTWWGQVTYGTAYNCSAGLQCLYSDTYRTEVVKNLEFQLENQCAPYNWSEAFEYKGRDAWVGMYVPPVSYGNLDSWGASFTKQALLQMCASVKIDGTVIIGRGIPDYWLEPGNVVEWANVNVNEGRRISFRIASGRSTIELRIWGDVRNGDVLFNLPAFKGNIAAANAGTVNSEEGIVTLSPTTDSVSVTLRHPPETKRKGNDRVKGPGGRIETLYPHSS